MSQRAVKSFVAALGMGLAFGAPAMADPGPQLVRSVSAQLAHYQISADVAALDTATVTALYLTMAQPEGYLKTRRTLQNILRRAARKE